MTNGFREYLLKQGNIKSNHIPYLIRWVGSFYSFLKVPDTCFITAEQKKQYLSRLSKTHEDWQVNQADTALRLYNYTFPRKLNYQFHLTVHLETGMESKQS